MKWLLFFVLLGSTVCVEAQSRTDLQKEKSELLRMHKADREAHFNTDVEALLNHGSESFIAVSNGKIYRATKADERKQFEGYFKDAKYYEWDDLEEPIVRISADGSMAWMITRVSVRRSQKDAAGTERQQRFIYAGIMTYEKRAGRWLRVANVSTFEQVNDLTRTSPISRSYCVVLADS